MARDQPYEDLKGWKDVFLAFGDYNIEFIVQFNKTAYATGNDPSNLTAFNFKYYDELLYIRP